MPHLLKRTDVRLGLVCAAGAITLGLGAFFLGASGADQRLGDPLGPPLAIAFVAPVEPVVLPGETMTVGMLNNGFDRAALDRIAVPEVVDTLPEPAWIGAPWRDDPPPATPLAAKVVVLSAEPPASRPDPLADGSQAFGFDRPRPDYASERRLRWEQREAAGASETADEKDAAPAPSNADVTPIKYSPE
jgi:hypothetical protein